MKIVHASVAAAAAFAALAACQMVLPPNVDSASRPTGSASVIVDLRVRTSQDAPYRQVEYFAVPQSHEIGDKMFPYEGIGWENGIIGYRLYLDGRLTSDVFGKRSPEPVLASINAGSNYHEMEDWGMDVLHVGPSLGIGGIGTMRGGEPSQFVAIGKLAVKVDEAGGETGCFTISASGIATEDGTAGVLMSRYTMSADSPLTIVSTMATPDLRLASGLAAHPDAQFVQSDASGQWRYIATFGLQSETKDWLGLALFYRADQAQYGGVATGTHYITFNRPDVEHGFLATWERGPGKISDRTGFMALLERERIRLERRHAE